MSSYSHLLINSIKKINSPENKMNKERNEVVVKSKSTQFIQLLLKLKIPCESIDHRVTGCVTINFSSSAPPRMVIEY